STELSILAKATAILLLALVALRIARRVPASVRSLVLASTFGVLLVLPIAAMIMPPVALEVGTAGITTETAGLSVRIDAIPRHYPVRPAIEGSANAAGDRRPGSVRLLLIIAWATGAVLFLVPVVETICRVR